MSSTGRQRLPNRRRAESFDFEVVGLKYTATVGRFHSRYSQGRASGPLGAALDLIASPEGGRDA